MEAEFVDDMDVRAFPFSGGGWNEGAILLRKSVYL